MKTYLIVFKNGKEYRTIITATSPEVALRRAFVEYKKARKELTTRSLNKTMLGEGINIYMRREF